VLQVRLHPVLAAVVILYAHRRVETCV
jgi:hypothetical protein